MKDGELFRSYPALRYVLPSDDATVTSIANSSTADVGEEELSRGGVGVGGVSRQQGQQREEIQQTPEERISSTGQETRRRQQQYKFPNSNNENFLPRIARMNGDAVSVERSDEVGDGRNGAQQNGRMHATTGTGMSMEEDGNDTSNLVVGAVAVYPTRQNSTRSNVNASVNNENQNYDDDDDDGSRLQDYNHGNVAAEVTPVIVAALVCDDSDDEEEDDADVDAERIANDNGGRHGVDTNTHQQRLLERARQQILSQAVEATDVVPEEEQEELRRRLLRELSEHVNEESDRHVNNIFSTAGIKYQLNRFIPRFLDTLSTLGDHVGPMSKSMRADPIRRLAGFFWLLGVFLLVISAIDRNISYTLPWSSTTSTGHSSTGTEGSSFLGFQFSGGGGGGSSRRRLDAASVLYKKAHKAFDASAVRLQHALEGKQDDGTIASDNTATVMAQRIRTTYQDYSARYEDISSVASILDPNLGREIERKYQALSTGVDGFLNLYDTMNDFETNTQQLKQAVTVAGEHPMSAANSDVATNLRQAYNDYSTSYGSYVAAMKKLDLLQNMKGNTKNDNELLLEVTASYKVVSATASNYLVFFEAYSDFLDDLETLKTELLYADKEIEHENVIIDIKSMEVHSLTTKEEGSSVGSSSSKSTTAKEIRPSLSLCRAYKHVLSTFIGRFLGALAKIYDERYEADVKAISGHFTEMEQQHPQLARCLFLY